MSSRSLSAFAAVVVLSTGCLTYTVGPRGRAEPKVTAIVAALEVAVALGASALTAAMLNEGTDNHQSLFHPFACLGLTFGIDAVVAGGWWMSKH